VTSPIVGSLSPSDIGVFDKRYLRRHWLCLASLVIFVYAIECFAYIHVHYYRGFPGCERQRTSLTTRQTWKTQNSRQHQSHYTARHPPEITVDSSTDQNLQVPITSQQPIRCHGCKKDLSLTRDGFLLKITESIFLKILERQLNVPKFVRNTPTFTQCGLNDPF
jgi:hypothetical protein